MKKRVVCCFLLASSYVLTLPATAQEKPAGVGIHGNDNHDRNARRSKSAEKAEAEVRQMSAAEVNAFLQNDPKAMNRIWSPEYVVTTPFNKFVRKQELMQMVTSGVLVITSYERRIEYVRVLGHTAIMAGSETVILGGKMPNPGKSTDLRFTAVWMRHGGRWREVARHGSIVTPAPASR